MRSKYAAFGIVLAFVLGLDQAGKRHVSESLAIGERVPLLGSLLAWTNEPAAGGALGIFRDWSPQAELFGYAILSGVAAMVVFVFLRSLAPRDLGTAVALGAVLSGVVSNSVDRYPRRGEHQFPARRPDQRESPARLQSRRPRDSSGGGHPHRRASRHRNGGASGGTSAPLAAILVGAQGRFPARRVLTRSRSPLVWRSIL